MADEVKHIEEVEELEEVQQALHPLEVINDVTLAMYNVSEVETTDIQAREDFISDCFSCLYYATKLLKHQLKNEVELAVPKRKKPG